MLSGTCVPRAARLDLSEQHAEGDRQPDRGEQQEQRQRVAQRDAPSRLREVADARPEPGCAGAARPERTDAAAAGEWPLRRRVGGSRGARERWGRLSCRGSGAQRSDGRRRCGRSRRHGASDPRASVTRRRAEMQWRSQKRHIESRLTACVSQSEHISYTCTLFTSSVHKNETPRNSRSTVFAAGMVLAQPHRSRERVVASRVATPRSHRRAPIKPEQKRRQLTVRVHRTLILSLIVSLAPRRPGDGARPSS